jgi:hypothetical protein
MPSSAGTAQLPLQLNLHDLSHLTDKCCNTQCHLNNFTQLSVPVKMLIHLLPQLQFLSAAASGAKSLEQRTQDAKDHCQLQAEVADLWEELHGLKCLFMKANSQTTHTIASLHQHDFESPLPT